MAFISPSVPLRVSVSSSAGLEIENFFVPLCLKINLSRLKINSARVAETSSAFCKSSYTKCASSAYFSTTLFQMPRIAGFSRTLTFSSRSLIKASKYFSSCGVIKKSPLNFDKGILNEFKKLSKPLINFAAESFRFDRRAKVCASRQSRHECLARDPCRQPSCAATKFQPSPPSTQCLCFRQAQV